jgi:hypothetical protein
MSISIHQVSKTFGAYSAGRYLARESVRRTDGPEGRPFRQDYVQRIVRAGDGRSRRKGRILSTARR